jgi:peptidoglycan/xylan/chitin deacetylase (PgdA/CDA1 family)
MKSSVAKSLPVVMYHYVNDSPGAITVSPACFEEHCRAMAEQGWRGVSLAEAEDFFLRGHCLPEKSLLISFDDGFLDNGLYALPLLRTYGHKAVMFAVSKRLEACGRLRIPPAGALCAPSEVPPHIARPLQTVSGGFLVRKDVFCNQAEVLAMDKGGIMAVAAHSRGHFGVFAGPQFSSFAAPGNQGRTFYLTEQGYFWGLPNFKVVHSLRHRAFLPNPDLLESIRRLVPQADEDAASFFAREENLRELRALAGRFAGDMGRFENDAERRERMWREIAGGKAELEAVLGHGLKSFCWPWGQYCPQAHALALEAGFSLLFTTGEGSNPPGRPLSIHRFKGGSKKGAWLVSRLRLYSRPLLGAAYARLRNIF